MSGDCCVALPRGDMGLSAVCDCGIFGSYSLTIFDLNETVVVDGHGCHTLLKLLSKLKKIKTGFLHYTGYLCSINLDLLPILVLVRHQNFLYW